MINKTKLKLNEKTFNEFLPENIANKSRLFFTPGDVAIQSAKWLTDNYEGKVLDIGAGIGKFCLFGAYFTKSEYFGIEMRQHLVDIAVYMFEIFEIKNAKIIHGNITDFQFKDFNAFYMYNPFHENLVPHLRMDNNALLSPDFYCTYMKHTRSQLAMAKKGTKLVTYHGTNFEVPASYVKVEEFFDGDLKYWIKGK